MKFSVPVNGLLIVRINRYHFLAAVNQAGDTLCLVKAELNLLRIN